MKAGNNMLNTKRMNNDNLSALILISPVIIFYTVFWLRPVYKAVIEAFTDMSGKLSTENYLRLAIQPDVQKALINTVVFVMGSMVLQFLLSIGISLFLNKKFRFSNLLLFITLIPMAFPPTAVGIMWKSGFYKLGWLNSILYKLHLISPDNLIDWMSLTNLRAVFFLILVDTWTVLPSIVIIILAGLQNLNREYEEAGWVFGANRFQSIKDIVIPIMKPTIATAIILRFIASVQVWLIAVMIFGYNVSPFLVERIAYNIDVITFARYAKKDAYALSVIVVVIVMIAAYAYARISRRSVKQEG